MSARIDHAYRSKYATKLKLVPKQPFAICELRVAAFGALALAVLVSGGSSAGEASPWGPQRASAEKGHNMQINITLGEKWLTASLADNQTARDFVSVLPLKLSMKDLFGREKYGDLPKPLSKVGPSHTRYDVGDIAYWSPNQQVAIYYRQDGESIPSPGIIPIAKIDAGVEALNVPGPVNVTIELSK